MLASHIAEITALAALLSSLAALIQALRRRPHG